LSTATPDLYALLGVSRGATTAELRRAYRRLALQHHPDRAGPASAPVFARIAEAYRMLADPTARAAYDAHLLEREGWRAAPAAPGAGTDGEPSDELDWRVGRIGWSASWPKQIPDLLPRVTGSVDDLVTARAARYEGGTLELLLTTTEAATGGTAIVTLPLRVLCPTCGGVARAGRVWCRRCEFDGEVDEAAGVRVRIPRAVPDGFMAAATVSRSIAAPPKVRIRVAR
jgi:molecular chaperone DnaJ